MTGRNSSDLYFGKIGFLVTGGNVAKATVGVLLIETDEGYWALSSAANVLLVVIGIGC